MSSSWKKVKSGRLSQLLSDGISERRRKGAGSPLVVQTGFPTSIIDLFVKNKDKLKNPLSKKQSKNKNDCRTCNKIDMSGKDHDYLIDCVPSPPPPPPPPLLSASPSNDFSGIVDGGDGDVGVSGVVVEDENGGENECVRGNPLFSGTVLRIFLVVVLALGTKMFVLGITFSAFVLLFLEYLVKQQFICLPCTECKEIINLIVTRVMGFLIIRKGDPEDLNSASKPVMKIEEKQGMMSDIRRGDEASEIELNEIQSEVDKIDSFDRKVEVVYIKDIIRGEAGEEFSTRKSRGAKMRLKMKKFLSKRLRKKEIQVDVGVENIGLIEEDEDQRLSNSNVGSSLSSISRYSSSNVGSCLSSISRDVDVELVDLSINQKEEETTQAIQHSSTSYVALVVVVLVGILVHGRVLALFLTLLWCLLLKSGDEIGRRCIKASSPLLKLCS